MEIETFVRCYSPSDDEYEFHCNSIVAFIKYYLRKIGALPDTYPIKLLQVRFWECLKIAKFIQFRNVTNSDWEKINDELYLIQSVHGNRWDASLKLRDASWVKISRDKYGFIIQRRPQIWQCEGCEYLRWYRKGCSRNDWCPREDIIRSFPNQCGTDDARGMARVRVVKSLVSGR
jgi:hypothetical protein